MRISHALGVVAMAACTLVATACSTTIDSLPLPAPGVDGDSYTLTATFANALNLPTKAKVKLDGADVGEVESMRASNYTAIVTMQVDSDVRLPVGTTAELRSATPIGDVFVGLTPPTNAAPDAPTLRNGDNIALQKTDAASTIEDLLTRASLIVNGGSIRDITKLLNALGERVGGRGDRIGELIAHTSELVGNLSKRSTEIRETLVRTNDLSKRLAAQQSDINDAIAAAGPALKVIGDNTQRIVDLVDQINRTTTQLARFPVIRGTNGRSLAADINTLAGGLAGASDNPKADLSSLNNDIAAIAKITNGQTAHVNVDVAKVILGAVADPNSPAAAASRLPDVTDIVNFVGSLSYSLNRLKDKVVGPGR